MATPGAFDAAKHAIYPVNFAIRFGAPAMVRGGTIKSKSLVPIEILQLAKDFWGDTVKTEASNNTESRILKKFFFIK
jgi:hypothetical protein